MNTLTVQKSTAKKLQNAGIELDTEFMWVRDELKRITGIGRPPSGKEYYFADGTFENDLTIMLEAPSLSELLAVIPQVLETGHSLKIEPGITSQTKDSWHFMYENADYEVLVEFDYFNPAETAAQLLIWLVDNGHINANEIEL